MSSTLGIVASHASAEAVTVAAHEPVAARVGLGGHDGTVIGLRTPHPFRLGTG